PDRAISHRWCRLSRIWPENGGGGHGTGWRKQRLRQRLWDYRACRGPSQRPRLCHGVCVTDCPTYATFNIERVNFHRVNHETNRGRVVAAVRLRYTALPASRAPQVMSSWAKDHVLQLAPSAPPDLGDRARYGVARRARIEVGTFNAHVGFTGEPRARRWAASTSLATGPLCPIGR